MPHVVVRPLKAGSRAGHVDHLRAIAGAAKWAPRSDAAQSPLMPADEISGGLLPEAPASAVLQNAGSAFSSGTRPSFLGQVMSAFEEMDVACRLHSRKRIDDAELSRRLNKTFKPLALMIAAIDLAHKDGVATSRNHHASELPEHLEHAVDDYLRNRRDLGKAKKLLQACAHAHVEDEVTFREPDFEIIRAAVKLDSLLTKRIGAASAAVQA